ncbi:MAG: hypothetical protein QOE31_3374 [Solirubrobacteraceae bacterium]|jgi:hypothetical protein|nr:hypothetical protein [Solirubrobacteraceae bacterium]
MTRSPARAAAPALTAVLALALLPSTAFGQATRTWVSGVGDDANPCSRTAPCKTFAGAISKTATGGEINVLDSGGYGAVTITKAITIKARGNTAGVLTNAANAINVNAGASDRVTLRGLDINGLGTASNGVRINSGKVVRIEQSEIFGFATAGVSFASTTANARLIIQDTSIQNNPDGNGVSVAPAAAGASTTIRRSEIDDNYNGVVAVSSGQTAIVNLFRSEVTDNVNGVYSLGALADIRIGSNDISGNGAGLLSQTSGKITTFGNNHVTGNTVDGNPTNSAALK